MSPYYVLEITTLKSRGIIVKSLLRNQQSTNMIQRTQAIYGPVKDGLKRLFKRDRKGITSLHTSGSKFLLQISRPCLP